MQNNRIHSHSQDFPAGNTRLGFSWVDVEEISDAVRLL
jgi:hypothetical protein